MPTQPKETFPRFFSKKWPVFLVFLSLCLFTPHRDAIAQAKAPARDWRTYPALVEVPSLPTDLYALGDVHGDYERLVNLLVAGKIIPSPPETPGGVSWSAGKAVLVCTGDFIDKGAHSLEVIALLQWLQREAAKAGGRFIISMGNHEAAFLVDPTNKKAAKFIAELQAKNIDPRKVWAGTDDRGIGKFMRSLPIAVRVGDWFFAHAGKTRGRTLKQLQGELQEGIDAHGYDIDLVSSLNDLVEARLHPLPWWEKEGDTPKASLASLTASATALGVNHFVIGHQPNKVLFSDGSKRAKGTMVQKMNGLVFLIDVGMSRGVPEGPYSEGALRHIHRGNEASALFPDGKRQRLWSKEGQDSIPGRLLPK